MSPGPLPEYVDASLAFSHGDRITASVTAGQFQRFRQYLFSESSPEDQGFRVELVFARDASGCRRINGHIAGKVMLECQRCLGPVECELDTEVALLVANDEESARDAGTNEEVIVATERDGHRVIELLPFVEDGLILALPLAPKHETDQCSMAWDNQNAVKTTSAGIAGQDTEMQDKLRALRDALAARNKE